MLNSLSTHTAREKMKRLLPAVRNPRLYQAVRAQLQKQQQCSVSQTAKVYNKSEEPLQAVKTNPYFEKYSQKIKALQENAPEEFESKIDEIKRERERQLDLKRQQAEEELKNMKEAEANRPKGLDAVMKLELVQDKSTEEITELWREYFKDKDVIFAAIPGNEYKEIMARSREYGTFVYPLPRAEGYEFFVQQFHQNEIHFTPLIMYQTHQDNAPPCLTLYHYTDLQESKDIVLMKGDPDLKVISVYEAQLLALQLQMYYGMRSGLKFNLVRQFNNAPDQFRHMDLVKEFEKIKQDYQDKFDARAK